MEARPDPPAEKDGADVDDGAPWTMERIEAALEASLNLGGDEGQSGAAAGGASASPELSDEEKAAMAKAEEIAAAAAQAISTVQPRAEVQEAYGGVLSFCTAHKAAFSSALPALVANEPSKNPNEHSLYVSTSQNL